MCHTRRLRGVAPLPSFDPFGQRSKELWDAFRKLVRRCRMLQPQVSVHCCSMAPFAQGLSQPPWSVQRNIAFAHPCPLSNPPCLQAAKEKLDQQVIVCELPPSSSASPHTHRHGSSQQHGPTGSEPPGAAPAPLGGLLEGDSCTITPLVLPRGVIVLQLELVIPTMQMQMQARPAAHAHGGVDTLSSPSLAWVSHHLPRWRPSPAGVMVLEALVAAADMGPLAAAREAAELLAAHQRSDQQRSEHFRCGMAHACVRAFCVGSTACGTGA